MQRRRAIRSVAGGGMEAQTSTLEWVGGRLQTSVGVQEKNRRFFADLVLWAEVETGLILGTKLAEPGRDPAALRTLFQAILEHPAAGPARVPGSVRVPTNEDAALVAVALPPGVSLRVAAVPELDAILADFEGAMRSKAGEASYFDDGLGEATLARLFHAASRLYRAAPWKTGYDCDLLCIDIPEIGANGLCVSILGANGEVFGFSLFESLKDYEAFIEAASEAENTGSPVRSRDFGAGWRLLSFDRGADLSKKMRREVRDHGWPIADARAYPTFSAHARNGIPRPMTDDDLSILAVCAAAVAAFTARHPRAFRDLEEDALSEEGITMEHRSPGLPGCIVTFPYDPKKWAAGRNWSGDDVDDGDEDQAEFVRQYKARHYASWPDLPLPALNGRTPRAACRTKSGRRAVSELLREMEVLEGALPQSERYDFDVLRGVLGL